MKIKDILTIDLSEDIKNVIDLEDVSEVEIQSEIESYIVTDGLAKDYSDFATIYTSNIKETGVWISGFYGSGKSYFGKLLGYLLSDKLLSGTSARERILQRFTGLTDEALVKNSLSRLSTIKSRVVFLDIAKQDTSKGLAYTLFRNFLRSLNLPENEHGFFLYHLMINEKQSDISDFVLSNLNKNWPDIKLRLVEYSKASKEIFLNKGNSENDYNNLITTIRGDIEQFSPARLKEELNNYLITKPEEKIVFLFDEASEAINQKKINLLELEGISEALSALGQKVWTIAIAQEKLDDVIRNSNITKAELTKLTDRFKTKIHLEATEVDVIIRNRLLNKTEDGVSRLKENYGKNSGKICDHASLIGSGVTKTDSAEGYATYYPFYKYQFDLLQNFLFGTKGYASTKVAARGLIITTYDILKQEGQYQELFKTVTGWQIAKEGQPQPPIRLVNRYDNAERILKIEASPISGRKLLETINFLSEAEVTPATLPNIVKSFISDPETYHKVQDEITKALELLVDAKILLDTNKTYRITSDVEQRLLDEMNGFTVQGFVKKKQLISVYKSSSFKQTISRVIDNGLSYDFYITTDNDDELNVPSQKYLKVKIKSIYNISDNRSADIESLKVQHQNDKDLIWLVPDNSGYKELDKLIDEVERISYLEQKYSNPNSDEGKIMVSFITQKGEKQNRIKDIVEESLANSSAIYLYNNLVLNSDNWQATLQSQQKQIIQNVYSKRLAAQLSDRVAESVIKEANNSRLHQYFSGEDFAFFDSKGNFIGENLKITEEILYKIRNTFVDGATLEKDLEQPPAGFSFGTVISSVAALMRAGKVIAKYNGSEKFSWRDEGVPGIFAAAREFRKASFKAVSKSLSVSQRQEIAQFLLDIEVEKFTGRKVDYNTNDFELVNTIRDTAKLFADKVATLKNSEKEFSNLFPKGGDSQSYLAQFTGAVSEANYIDKAEEFLGAKDKFNTAIQNIEKIEKFIRNNLSRVVEWKRFVEAVKDELIKASLKNDEIKQLTEEFRSLVSGDVIKNYSLLQQTAQRVKDCYHGLFTSAVKICSQKYAEVEVLAISLIDEINTLPANLNKEAMEKTSSIIDYSEKRKISLVEIEFDVKDKNSRFTFSEVLSFIDLYGSKKAEIDIIRAGLVSKAPDVNESTIGTPSPLIRTFSANIPAKKMKVAAYKEWLKQELQKLSGADDSDEIEIN